MTPMAGDHFGPYEILGTLGRGGVGEVYRAWDRRLEREVALKLLHDDYPQPGNRERFMIEARAASALNHANICTIFDVGSKDGWPYLVMELLKGITLKQRIERSSMSAEEIVSVATEMAGALGAAHALGIIHRDVKPANVMLTKQADGRTRVKVLDFGLAKLTGPLPGQLNHREEHLTVVGEAVGTVSYMSPEQARGDELDGRSDLFSLGVVMYEMATRRTPFHGSTTALLFAQLLGHDPEPIREWNEAIPRALEKVIFRLLEKDPARRFREARDVVEALEQVASKLGGSRWRRGVAPAVPLVRVEEPVARAELPMKPEFLREQPKVARASSARWQAEEAHPAGVECPQIRAASSRTRIASGSKRNGWGESDGNGLEARESRFVQIGSIAKKESVPAETPRESSRLPVRELLHEEPREWLQEPPIEPSQVPVRESSQELVIESSPEPAEVMQPVSSGRVRRANSSHVPVAPVERLESLAEVPAAEMTAVPQAGEQVHPAWAGGHFLRVADSTDYDTYLENGARSREWRARTWIGAGVAAAVLCTAGAVFKVRAAGNHGAALALSDGVMVTAIENHTGVQALDGSIAEGLEFQLAQSEAVTVRGVDEFRTTLHAMGSDGQPISRALARQAAETAGARAFLYGEVREGEPGAHSTGAGFLLHVGLFDTAAGRELTSVEAKAERTQEIAGAIDQVANDLVRGIADSSKGSRGREAARKQVPLAREATGSVNALHAYAVAVEAQAQGRRTAALRSFVLAAATDPSFVQAQMAAAWLGRNAGAEGSSVQEAARAMGASGQRSPRTVLLATVVGELIGRGDPDRAMVAATTLLQQNAQDVPARLAMVRALRAAGKYEEAAKLGQEDLTAGVRNGELYRETELALVALDRYDAALTLEDTSSKQAEAHPEIVLEAAYLAGKEERAQSALTAAGKNAEDAVLLGAARAVYLDNIGELADGQAEWSNAARAARVQAGMSGAGELMLAKAALNRAVTGQCAAASQLARVAASRTGAGREARADAALAGALCGDTEVSGQLAGQVADARVRAAKSLAQGEPEAAAQALTEAGEPNGDPVSLFLQGMAHLQAGGATAAIQDFKTILQHRGATYGTGTDLYAAAQLKLARAYIEAGERSKSMDAYRQFLRVWDGAGSNDRLRVEATAGARGAFPAGQLEVPRVLVASAGTAALGRHAGSGRRREASDFPTPAWLLPNAGGGATGQGIEPAAVTPSAGRSARTTGGDLE